MTTDYHIRILQRQEIDLLKWDACVEEAPNGMIYGKSFYLDFMTAGAWDALVLGDYEAVMPLCRRKKWGIRYLYQPAFTQQGGIFAGAALFPLPSSLIEAFLAALRREFRFAEVFLNHGNAYPTLKPHANFIFHLNAGYEELSGRYKEGLEKSLRVAVRSSFTYIKGVDLREVLASNERLYQDRFRHVSKETYRRFEELCQFLQNRQQLIIRAVKDPGGELLATALLPVDHRRIYLLRSTIMPAGRATGANHFLLDSLIREFAGQPLILDFEGSDLPGIAHFYRSFGAQDQPYFFYRHNRLPWPLRFLK